jgi:hypothetical protein
MQNISLIEYIEKNIKQLKQLQNNEGDVAIKISDIITLFENDLKIFK